MLLNDPNKILEEEEEPRGGSRVKSKKGKKGKESGVEVEMTDVGDLEEKSRKGGKDKKKGKSATTAAQSATGTEMEDGDATSRGGDVTS